MSLREEIADLASTSISFSTAIFQKSLRDFIASNPASSSIFLVAIFPTTPRDNDT